MEKYEPNSFERAMIIVLGCIKSFISRFLYKSIKNEVWHLRRLRQGSYLCLNDVIKHREPSFGGADPEPLIECWISPKDYDTEIIPGDFSIELKINYRCKINYVAKNKSEQNTAFVIGTATIKEGIVRTREPRALLIPFYYMARIVSGFYH